MQNIQQLIKKDTLRGGYENVFPKTFLDAVKDKKTGLSLTDILSGFNMYFLSYTGSIESTRLQVPTCLRKTGLWITYVKYDKTVITEWYAGDDISDNAWGLDSNWKPGLVENIWMNHRGFSDERPTLTLLDDGYPFYDRNLKKYILWNGTGWINIDGSLLD